MRSLCTGLALTMLLAGCSSAPTTPDPVPVPTAAPAPAPAAPPPAAGNAAPAPGYGVQHLDKDGDGHVSLEEYKAALQRKFAELDRDKSGTIHVEKECNPLFITFCKKADANNDGHISQAEFLAHGEREFKAADKNQDGKLTHEELSTVGVLGWRSPWR
jgi:Ca2+-binding EF-hand superfamily protein